MQVWYDDPHSLELRYRLAAELGLRGVGLWNLDLLDYSETASLAAQQQTREMWAGSLAYKVTACRGAVSQVTKLLLTSERASSANNSVLFVSLHFVSSYATL